MREFYGIEGAARLRPMRNGVLVEPVSQRIVALEDEPEFATFLEFLVKDALSHPEMLLDAESYRERDRTLLPSRKA